VKWIPDNNNKLSGEVEDGVIYVYDEDESEALETLRHESPDYAIRRVIEPYKNRLQISRLC
jgi:hypothetical protein